MSSRPGGRRLHGGVSSGSQHDIRNRRRDFKENRDEDERQERSNYDGGGDGAYKGKMEEVRISRLTRLLARLDNEESFLTTCCQIEGALNEAENQKYVCRCFQCLCPSFSEVFKGLGGLTWEAAGTKRFALLLSKICKAMENQTSRFFQWIVDSIVRASRGSQTYVSSSAYVMESVSIHLLNQLDREDTIIFVKCVYDVLEDVCNPNVFRVLGAIFVGGTNLTSSSWRNPHFQDFIDLVVGWMVDVRQASGQFSGCSELLEHSKCQFMGDIRFLVTLMSQLLEDLEQAIKKVQSTSQSDSDEFLKVLQLIRAFTALLSLECPVDKTVVTEFCDRLVASTLQFIRMSEPHKTMDRKYRYELLSTVNKGLFYAGGVLGPSITKYFRAQLKLGSANSSYMHWPKPFLTSFLESFAVWMEVAVSQTQLSEDLMDISSVLLNMMDDMHNNLSSHDQHYVMNLVIALLRTRNVNLLQKTYGWLISQLPSEKKCRSISVEEDHSCLFVLAGLSDLISNKSSSILSLWALQPTVFELLVDITNMKVHKRTQHCAMELLKTHCSVHSHFVSSFASTGTFNTDSPGTRFLPALMNFWLEKMQALPEPEDEWVTEWVFEFLQSTSSYSTLLYEANPDFYERFVNFITEKKSLMVPGMRILNWFCEDPGYTSLQPVCDKIRTRVITILLEEKVPARLKNSFHGVLYNMPQLVIIPDAIFLEDCAESEIDYDLEAESKDLELTSTEFNLFLHELLVGNSPHIPLLVKSISTKSSPTNSLLSVAADHLIRLKLRTPLGKPQDFFGNLLLIFKRSRASKTPVPSWKLHFIFELEKKFQLWIHGSAVDETDLTEHVKTFYLMNKSPFLEWLKKIRSEIIETCIFSKEYALGYFNAALMGDTQKMEYVLFKLKDSIGLKGMNNLIASYYLEGRYEEALNLIESGDSLSSNALHEDVKTNSKAVLDDCFEKLQKWTECDDFQVIDVESISSQLYDPSATNILDLQLRNQNKFDLATFGNPDIIEVLKLPVIQKIYTWIMASSNENIRSKQVDIERIWTDKMLEAGNIDYTKNWLVKNDIDVNNIQTDEDLSSLSLSSVPAATLKLCADFYLKKLEYGKSVVLYNILRELVTGSMNSDLANKVTMSICSKILECDDFFTTFSSESFSHTNRFETVQSLHQVALQSFPECYKSWIAFGDFAYNQSEDRSPICESTDAESLKYTAVECYTKYIQLTSELHDASVSSPRKLYSPKIVVMTRLLQLFREGFSFTPDDCIISSDWLPLLAEIVQIPELRSFILEKYPEQASLFLTSYDAARANNKLAVRRRNLFDMSPYSFVDTSEEPLSSSVILANLSQLEKRLSDNTGETECLQYQIRSDLNLPKCASVFAQELLHLASSMEDMWAWSLERIAVDWYRRLAYLRKECTRSSSAPEKVQAFILPIFTYLETLLCVTVASQTLADVNFLNRHKNDIRKHLDLLSSATSAEDASYAMNSFLKYSERFGILMNNKLPVSMFSTKLADPEFYEASNFSLCLPGQPSHLKVNGLHAMVQALPTKAKPKRIRLLASNGKYYDYLVKGTENLNIDCGVMQFLNVTQSIFGFSTRTFSVTPLGKRGGLIQIVPDAIPLFTLYKRHLQRNKCLEKTSEMFWRRMNSLGYEDRSSISALREVYETLCNETSCDLITRELLLSAETPSQWLHSVQTFTQDCAVGSAVGYLLGIGDRHLDNMLVNVNRGKFIHVDFTIIFGKGTTLRVPERVPFRLTQNIASVLQYPGPSGMFSVILQDVLSSFQEYRSTAVHLIKNIAFSHQYDEDSPVDLTKILLSEVESAVKLFLCRLNQDIVVLQGIRQEIQEAVNSGSEPARKITKKINRWRRMLVNLNTVLQFISSAVQTSGPFATFTSLVQTKWSAQFQICLEMGMDQPAPSVVTFFASLDSTEKLLNELKEALTVDTNADWKIEMLNLQDANIQFIDTNKVAVLVKSAEMNIQAYNPASTVSKLVDEATNVDNLAQMYEGWTSWV